MLRLDPHRVVGNIWKETGAIREVDAKRHGDDNRRTATALYPAVSTHHRWPPAGVGMTWSVRHSFELITYTAKCPRRLLRQHYGGKLQSYQTVSCIQLLGYHTLPIQNTFRYD